MQKISTLLPNLSKEKMEYKIVKEEENFETSTLVDKRRPIFIIDRAFVDIYLPKVGLSASAIYMVLSRKANYDNIVFLSVPSLAKQAQCSPNTVRKALRELEKHNIIKINPRKSDKGDPTSNEYVLNDFKDWKSVKVDIQP